MQRNHAIAYVNMSSPAPVVSQTRKGSERKLQFAACIKGCPVLPQYATFPYTHDLVYKELESIIQYT
jgi:hypothetical protein